MTEEHGQVGVENVIVEEHTVNLSAIVDVTGTPSIEIADETGSGKATLFRDGRAIRGRWEREDVRGSGGLQDQGGRRHGAGAGSRLDSSRSQRAGRGGGII